MELDNDLECLTIMCEWFNKSPKREELVCCLYTSRPLGEGNKLNK